MKTYLHRRIKILFSYPQKISKVFQITPKCFYLSVWPVTDTFQQLLNSNCRNTFYTSQTPKRVENRNIKPIVGHLPAESQQDLFKVINKHVRTTSKGSDWCEPIVHLILVVWLMRREISTWRVSISQLKVQSYRLKTCWKMIAYVLEVYLERYASKQFTDLQSFTRKMCFFFEEVSSF